MFSFGGKVLTYQLAEPLNGATTAKVEIDVGGGNLSVDTGVSSKQQLASGILEYTEKQGEPIRAGEVKNGQAILTLKANNAGQPWWRTIWTASGRATGWQIHLNPTVRTEIAARTGGGNITLNLGEMPVTEITAETGGGNVTLEVGKLTARTSTIKARSGAGNVAIQVPRGISAKIHATSGMGKVTVGPQFKPVDKTTFQSPDYETAANKVEIALQSGAGNVSCFCNS